VEVADQFLLLGVRTDHRLLGILVIACLLVEVPRLCVPVRVLAALERPGTGLRAEALLSQQVGDGVRIGG
jgi:hypothetical protein